MSLQNCYGDNNGFKCGWKSCVDKHEGYFGRYNGAQSTQDVIGTVEHEGRRKIRTESIIRYWNIQHVGNVNGAQSTQDVIGTVEHEGRRKIRTESIIRYWNIQHVEYFTRCYGTEAYRMS
jgi:hypothetical protein